MPRVFEAVYAEQTAPYLPDFMMYAWNPPTNAIPGALFALELAGRSVGWAALRMAETDPELWLFDMFVLPEYRRHGIGTQGYVRLVQYLRRRGARRLLAGAGCEQQAGRSFLGRQGFQEIGGMITYQLNLATSARTDWGDPDALLTAQGLRFATLDRFPRHRLAERLLPLWNRTRPDQPQHWPYRPYHARRLEQEMLEPEAVSLPHSFVIVTPGGQLVALALSARLSDTCLASIYLGVDPDFRGRRLATALKQKLLAHAQGHGITLLIAENDRRTLAMHTINRRLGFTPRSERLVFAQALP